MDYDDVVQALFPARPEGTAVPAAVRDGSPARRLRDAEKPVARAGGGVMREPVLRAPVDPLRG